MKKASDLRIPFTWAERHSVLLDRFLYIPGYYEKHVEWSPIPWSDERLFGNDDPIAIEYCSGNGQWICTKAKEHPRLNWVAVEKRFDRARKIWARLHRESIPNVFVVCGEAVAFTRYYIPLHSVSEIFVNFPDPWPKLRHAKHRMIRKEFLEEIEKIIIPLGKAIFVTDDFSYATQMLETISNQPRWKALLPKPYYSTKWNDYGHSFFCELWKKKGRTIFYLSFEVRE